MIALGLRYLTKYAVATDSARQRAEWPPHPGRIFMAMAAAHFETDADPAERVALEWLESAPPPAMRASAADERSIVRTYVPVNDNHGGVLSRSKQDRAFPRVRPHDESVFLIWNANPDGTVRMALEHVCRKVTRVGHSSSAVQMWVVAEGEEPEPNLLPGSGISEATLRVPSSGTMKSLVTSFDGNDVKRSRRPQLVSWQAYEKVTGQEACPTLNGPFDENFIVLTKEEGPALGLEPTLRLTAALRNAAMKAAGANPPEWLTGHSENGLPSMRPHVAFFPLPYVGSEFADAHVLGLGIAIPKDLGLARDVNRDAELRRVLGPLFFDIDSGEERDIHLWSVPTTWKWCLRREVRERPPLSLQRTIWTRPSRTWASVTPVVLHHHPKKNRDGDVERIIQEAFVSAGFPEPEYIEVTPVSTVAGAGHAMSMPPFTEGGAGLCRYQTHAEIRFRQPVRGPMLVGRGRFRGYGLFRPVSAREAR